MPMMHVTNPGDILTFGKYKGRSVDDVMMRDIRYMQWAVQVGAITLSDDVAEDLHDAIDAAQDCHYDGDWWHWVEP